MRRKNENSHSHCITQTNGMSDQRKTSGDGKSSSLSRVTPRGSQNILNPYLDSSSKSRGIRQMHGRTSSTPTPQDERCADEEKKQDQKRKVTGSPNKIQVNKRQEKNPVLRYLRNVPFEVTPGLLADFVFSPKMCAVFISVRYHLLYPNYLIQRIKELSRHFTLRILLCHVDVHDCEKPLLDINKTAVLNDFTFILAWSLQEAARYLETYKAYEQKSAESIQEKVEDDYLAKLQDCLGVIRSVNKSDVLTLASNFGSFEAMCDASAEELALCPGVGEKKVTRIHEALHEPLSRAHRQKRIRQETEEP